MTRIKNAGQYVEKDPDDKLDYDTDWSDWLVGGDTIATSVWVVPEGITKTDEDNTDTVATIWLTGGTKGKTYNVVNRITTTQGRIKDRTKYVSIREA